ncbi:MAG TPA: HEAT repeat domain-containing protein [Blastocatellia bacterium]|nr:HEAT repeat domain-containing protein [Blastocatellia bacterium]
MKRVRPTVLIAALVAAGLSSGAAAWAQSPAPPGPIRALPLYQPCSQLRPRDEAPLAALPALRDPSSSRRAEAAESLARSCDPRAVEPLATALGDAEVSVRLAAIEALGRLGGRQALDSLIKVTADPDWRVRAGLARTLCSFQLAQSSSAALNLLVNPGDRAVDDEGDLRARCLGILLLNQLRDVRFSRKAILILFHFLAHREDRLRLIAEETALELRQTRNGYHELIGILKQDRYPDYRRRAAYWLGRFAVGEAGEALAEAAAADPDPEVRRIAAAALKR